MEKRKKTEGKEKIDIYIKKVVGLENHNMLSPIVKLFQLRSHTLYVIYTTDKAGRLLPTYLVD